MFPRAQRIRASRDILAVFRRGERARTGPVSLFYLPLLGGETRVTVIADKKVSKKAVVRNQVKRQVRAILQQADLPPGLLIARCFSGSETLPFNELRSSVLRCLSHPKFRPGPAGQRSS